MAETWGVGSRRRYPRRAGRHALAATLHPHLNFKTGPDWGGGVRLQWHAHEREPVTGGRGCPLSSGPDYFIS